MNTLKQLILLLSILNEGDLISRKDIMLLNEGGQTTIDNYRNWFCKAGYLKWEKQGYYRLIKKPDENLTSVALRKEAYPNSKKKR